jgi:hypothetical protein
MYRQINYMLNKDVGFNKEQLIVIERAHALGSRVKAFKDEVRQIPGVVNIASSTAVPNRNNNNNGYGIEGRQQESYLLQTNWIDYNYLDTYGMKVVQGAHTFVVGMQTMDSHIARLLEAGRVKGEEAYMKAFDKKLFEKHWSFAVDQNGDQ